MLSFPVLSKVDSLIHHQKIEACRIKRGIVTRVKDVYPGELPKRARPLIHTAPNRARFRNI
jgi:hypothetical protein